MPVSRIDLMNLNSGQFIPETKKTNKESFEDHLKKGFENVNNLQLRAEREVQKLVTGDVDDISQVVTAVAEAEIALRLFVEVRDKLVDAYQQLSRIPV
ncbi:flagellar hook-basal body complex protein FliE [Acetomicrobium sp.]|uniref:flagellar hook-basal body complex protein FliE n=1 Tax=Acetomicrobium sp. TaxID=1872099 RepID=UPI00235B5FC8|nr:flagellar hook-basal body complex protein FliE [Acetomicrobium sp.]